jgi:hypothetical protein
MGLSPVVYIGPGWLEVKINGKIILPTFHFGSSSRSFGSSHIHLSSLGVRYPSLNGSSFFSN